MTDESATAHFIRIGPERPASPVILSVPHAGRDYSPGLLKAARLPRYLLETLEDRLVDRLVWQATAAGATAFIAQTPRAEIDLNRGEREIDPSLIAPPLPAASIVQSMRTRGGIGLIPSRITGAGAIWKERIPQRELLRRLEQIHRPYHQALESALRQARERFGVAMLLDCHSMPPRPKTSPDSEAAVVFGDRFGATANAGLTEAAVEASRGLGYRTAVNSPYAGGHVVARHGQPGQRIHALQIEIDRSAYLDAELRAPGPGFAATCRLIAAVVEALENQLLEGDQAIAAE